MSDQPARAYLVGGSDPTLRDDAVRELVRGLVGDGDAGLAVEEHVLDADHPDLAPVVDAARTPPFLSDRRVVVVRAITSASAEAVAPLVEYLAEPLDTTTLVLVAGDAGRIPKVLADAVKAVGESIDTSAPRNARARESWMAAQLRQAPVHLDAEAAEELDRHLGEDLGRLAALLDALAAAYGAGARVTGAQLEPFLGTAGSVPPWQLTDAVDRGDTRAALEALDRLLAAGERHPLVVLATLSSHYLRMLRLDGAEIGDEQAAAAALGMKGSTYPAKKALTQLRRLGHDGVLRAVALLADADLDLRGAKGWPDRLVLEVLVARLSRLVPNSTSRVSSGRRR